MWSNGCSIRSGCGSSRKGHPEFGIERLYLVSGGAVLIGNFLGPEEKASLAKAFSGRTATPPSGARPIIRSVRACLESGGLSSHAS